MKKAILIPVLAFAFTALGLIALAETAMGAPDYYEQEWSQPMNQTSYWSPWECTKYNNHGGWIPAQYDAAIIKAGQKVRVYPNLENVGAFQASAPDGKDISWVMKCTKPTPPTTQPPTTTEPPVTTQPPTTEPPVTTQPPATTIPETTVATTVPPTTAPPTTDSSVPPSTEPPVEQPTTSQPPSSAPPSDPSVPPAGDPVPELPATGGELHLGVLAFALLAAGAGLTAVARRSATA